MEEEQEVEEYPLSRLEGKLWRKQLLLQSQKSSRVLRPPLFLLPLMQEQQPSLLRLRL